MLFYFTWYFGCSAYASQFLICVKIKEKKVKQLCWILIPRNRTGNQLLLNWRSNIVFGCKLENKRNRTVSVIWRLNIVFDCPMNTRGIEPCVVWIIMNSHECRIYRINVVYCIKVVPKESPTHNIVHVK